MCYAVVLPVVLGWCGVDCDVVLVAACVVGSMCVYMYICVYVYMWICVYVYVFMCTYMQGVK